jgi:hypothetical protein
VPATDLARPTAQWLAFYPMKFYVASMSPHIADILNAAWIVATGEISTFCIGK